jgi:hypothetical protein
MIFEFRLTVVLVLNPGIRVSKGVDFHTASACFNGLSSKKKSGSGQRTPERPENHALMPRVSSSWK